MIQNGTRQGSVLFPYLFSRYIKELLGAVANSGIGCNVANQFVNILAYEDDVVLIAPSWRGLQSLMSLLCKHAVAIDMSVNKNKTVCMIFKPKIAIKLWPVSLRLMIDDHPVDFVKTFTYLDEELDGGKDRRTDIRRRVMPAFQHYVFVHTYPFP